MGTLNIYIGDRDSEDWPTYMMEFYKKIPTDDLVEIAEHGEFIDDIPTVLEELYDRDMEKGVALTKAILEHKKGDEYLQSWAAEFLLDNDFEEYYVTKFLNENSEVRAMYDSING